MLIYTTGTYSSSTGTLLMSSPLGCRAEIRTQEADAGLLYEPRRTLYSKSTLSVPLVLLP
jgi:hypothetical protein